MYAKLLISKHARDATQHWLCTTAMQIDISCTLIDTSGTLMGHPPRVAEVQTDANGELIRLADNISLMLSSVKW